jgi:hypothetical protein
MEEQAKYQKKKEEKVEDQKPLVIKPDQLSLPVIMKAYNAFKRKKNIEYVAPFKVKDNIVEESKLDMRVTNSGVHIENKDKKESYEIKIFLSRNYIIDRLFENGLHLETNKLLNVAKDIAIVSFIKPEFKSNKSSIILPNISNENKVVVLNDFNADPHRMFVEKVYEGSNDVEFGDIVSIHPKIIPVTIVVEGKIYMIINLTRDIVYVEKRHKSINVIDTLWETKFPERVSVEQYQKILQRK